MSLRSRLAAAILGAAALLSASVAEAGVRRFAVVVGANEGDRDEVVLRYAETDAQRIARILSDLGGFAREDIAVLAGGDAEEVRRALIALNVRVREESGDTVLFVFYSGHADAEALHLRGSRLPMSDLRGLVEGSPASVRLLVIDACRSGAMTRVKGGRPGAAFAIDFDRELAARGVAILTSSAAGEDSQESDKLGSSFFTHYLASGLVGAADRNDDGEVTLAEAFGYASERTLVATAGTVAGPQHATFRFDLGGREDLVLTAPGLANDRMGHLEIASAGSWLVQRGGADGPVVAELSTARADRRRLALTPGTYLVTRRDRDALLQGEVSLERGGTASVEPGTMRRIAYAQVVRKGESPRIASASVFTAAGGRTEINDLGGARRFDAGARFDFRPVSLEVRAGSSRSATVVQTPFGPDTLGVSELSFGIAALRAFDAGRTTFSGGVEVGGYRMAIEGLPPQFPKEVVQDDGFTIGALLVGEVTVWRGLHVRGDAAWLLYTEPLKIPDPNDRIRENVWAWRGTLGLGWHF